MIRKIIVKKSLATLSLRLCWQISAKEEFLQKLAKKDYHSILGINTTGGIPNLEERDLQQIYMKQVRKYHSDKVISDEEKAEYDEITKCINQAYAQLKRKKPTGFWQKSQPQHYTVEDEVAEKMFGKRYSEIKHNLYASGNQHLRFQFIEELQKRTKQGEGTTTQTAQPNYSQKSTRAGSATQSSGSGGNGLSVALGIVLCLGLVPFLQSKPKAPTKKAISGGTEEEEEDLLLKQHKVKQYSQEELDIIHLNTKKIAIKPFERFLNNLMRRRPHMLKYPSGEDPSILDQLTTYSIAQDIHLYEVSSKYFISYEDKKQLLEANSVESVQKYELKEAKPNTTLTLSLEAERMLHNIYVNVDDVLAEIKQNGKFTPPKVFFKFFGYIMFEIRQKPFSTLQNYRNTKYISLFDLYFDYYSPIFFKRNYFCDYLVGLDKEEPLKNTRYFGNVHLNHRGVPSQYLQKGQKVVVMRDLRTAYNSTGKRLREWEQKYQQAWENYYARFEKNWKKYSRQQAEEI